MNQATVAAIPQSQEAAPPAVAPFITAAVGDVARPRRALKANADLGHFPGDGGLLVGLQTLLGWTRHGVGFVLEKERRFGRVFRTQVGPVPYVYVSEPDLIAQMMRNEDRVWSTALAWHGMLQGLEPSRETIDSSVTLDFDPHRDARKLLQPAFGATATASYLETALPHFERAVDSWVRTGRVDFKAAIRTVLARVSTLMFLGIDDETEAAAIERATGDAWGTLLAVAKNRWLSPQHRRAVAGYSHLLATLTPLVAERRARGGEDLFSRLCAVSVGPDGFDDERIVRLFIGILMAAFDTTACGLTSMAYLLARHPEWQERLREEARSLGRPRVGYEDTKRLEATERAWKETLRLMPVTGGLARYALRDTQLGDWRVAAGTCVSAMAGAALRAGSAWTDPDRFDPDRFSEERAEDRHQKGLFLPFGSGAHSCIGMNLATVEAKAFWHAMLTRCEFRLERDYEARHTYVPLGIVSGNVALVVKPVA